MILKLSVTASGQVWNVYLIPLLSYVAQIFLPPLLILEHVNSIMTNFMDTRFWLSEKFYPNVTWALGLTRFPVAPIAQLNSWFCARFTRVHCDGYSSYLNNPRIAKARQVKAIVQVSTQTLWDSVAWHKTARRTEEAGQGTTRLKKNGHCQNSTGRIQSVMRPTILSTNTETRWRR